MDEIAHLIPWSNGRQFAELAELDVGWQTVISASLDVHRDQIEMEWATFLIKV